MVVGVWVGGWMGGCRNRLGEVRGIAPAGTARKQWVQVLAEMLCPPPPASKHHTAALTMPPTFPACHSWILTT